MRQKVTDFTRPLRRQAREYVLQIDIRIMAVKPCRLDQAHDRSRTGGRLVGVFWHRAFCEDGASSRE